jgi:4-hydroxybenzoate polyprenyltransferase
MPRNIWMVSMDKSISDIGKMQGTAAAYLAIARLDHSAKHIFIVPGMVLAYLLRGIHTTSLVSSITLGLIAAICIASANYVINEWFDREFDKFHPTKSQRAAVKTELSGTIIFLEWIGLVAVGLACAFAASKVTLIVACLFALQGIVYNVPGARTKDKAYLDVISESVNNPLRLVIGWAMIDPTTLPPSSIILTYWSGGAFLMAAKRLSEFREITASYGREVLERYRASFAGYSEISLTVSCFVYALVTSFFLAVFLIKYRVEYLLTVPVLIALFGHYLALSMQPESTAQKPEKLFRERGLIVLVGLLAITFLFATSVDIPALEIFSGQRYISLQ